MGRITPPQLSQARASGAFAPLSEVAARTAADGVLDDKIDVEIAARSTSGMGFVNHGATASTARPSGYASVTWLGSVEPDNWVAGDFWENPS